MIGVPQDNTPGGSLEGRVLRPANLAELNQAIDMAFDYRGDVTLELVSGEKIEGYVFNRSASASPPALQIYPAGQPGARVIRYADIAAIVFSGEDTASGKSWEAWVRKKESG